MPTVCARPPLAVLAACAACSAGSAPDSGSSTRDEVQREDSQRRSVDFDSGAGGAPEVILGAAGQGGNSSGLSEQEQCAATFVEAKPQPVMLSFLVDRSGSMGGPWDPEADPLRWQPVTSALEAFFADKSSTGLMASLQLFPLTNTTNSMVCHAAAYADPVVPMTALPDASAFSQAVELNPPATHGGTPTITAFEGFSDYVRELATDNPEAQIVAVLVTDGEPHDCDQQRHIGPVAEMAAAMSPDIPTYAIGVGNVANLQKVSLAGGTFTPYVVNVSDPAATQKQFLGAVNDIRKSAIACDVEIPPIPAGETFDPGLININYTPAGEERSVPLVKSTDCSGLLAWRYDDEEDPSMIELCADTCEAIKAKAGGSVDVAFGCVSRIY